MASTTTGTQNTNLSFAVVPNSTNTGYQIIGINGDQMDFTSGGTTTTAHFKIYFKNKSSDFTENSITIKDVAIYATSNSETALATGTLNQSVSLNGNITGTVVCNDQLDLSGKFVSMTATYGTGGKNNLSTSSRIQLSSGDLSSALDVEQTDYSVGVGTGNSTTSER